MQNSLQSNGTVLKCHEGMMLRSSQFGCDVDHNDMKKSMILLSSYDFLYMYLSFHIFVVQTYGLDRIVELRITIILSIQRQYGNERSGALPGQYA